MEPKSRRPESGDQLQSSSVQDQELSSHATTSQLSAGHKVVVRLEARTLQGYALAIHGEPISESSSILLQRMDGSEETIQVADAEAIFFEKEFLDGEERAELIFYENAPIMEHIWVRISYRDGKVIEGMVLNDSQFICSAGFIMLPTDPTSNHWLIYVAKRSVESVIVLGLRHGSNTLTSM